MRTQMELRSRKDYELEAAFIDKHTKEGGEIIVDESGRIMHAVYRNPLFSFYKNTPDTAYAYSDMTEKIDAVIKAGPGHPDAKENIKKIMDGTI